MILRSKKYSASPKSGALFFAKHHPVRSCGRGLIFGRFHGFEKQLPHLVHSLSQLCNIFGIYAVGAVDSLANLRYFLKNVRCIVKGKNQNDNSQKFYIRHPIIFQENVRLK